MGNHPLTKPRKERQVAKTVADDPRPYASCTLCGEREVSFPVRRPSIYIQLAGQRDCNVAFFTRFSFQESTRWGELQRLRKNNTTLG